MTFDPATTSIRDFYRHMISCITPRPIAWVSTISPRNVPNLAPFSFFNGVGANPPAVVFSPTNRRDGSPKDTLINVEKSGQFVVNVVSESVAKLMNDTSAEIDYEISEFELCGLTPIPASARQAADGERGDGADGMRIDRNRSCRARPVGGEYRDWPDRA